MRGKYANVIVDIAHEKVDRPFQYKIPKQLMESLEEGMAVTIPFGRGNKEIQGYVVKITDKAEFPEEKLKELLDIRRGDISVEASFMRLAGWMKRQYGSTMITALKTVLPVKQRTKELEKRTLKRLLSLEATSRMLAECERKNQKARVRLLQELVKSEELPYELVTQKLNITAKTIRDFREKGVLEVESVRQYRNPVRQGEQDRQRKELSETQINIADAIIKDCLLESPGVHLLHGITGSGKTEVYLRVIEKLVQEGKQAIVLIPEISLTYQTLMRFYNRFGNRVSVMNSKLSQGERYDQFERAKKGEIDIMIGPRSALFTPFLKLGIIVIDEEHENSYKSESMPKFHARETAIYIAKEHGAGVLLGSATPSLESYYRAEKGEYRLYEMTKRLTGGCLPTVYTIDLREELKTGNRSIFSRKLQELMAERLLGQEQIMLFLNRRGYAGFISCRACGLVMKCPHCDVSLSEHSGQRLVCHYCGYETPKVTSCPACGSKYILGFRAGTEQIEEQVKRLYPKARVLRMDGDTTKGKESYDAILSAFANEEADILIGTQMIVKGHDFPSVTLVGILAADMSLSANDYRAAERTFQLLTQAAGRAGRGKKPGEVVIQTYQPEHYSIVHAANQDYTSFYEEEMEYRELLSYPPAAHMMAVQVMSKKEEEAKKLAETLARLAREEKNASVIGPATASIGKIKDVYRYGIYIKQKNYAILIHIKDRMEVYLESCPNRQETVQFDFDPMNAY